MRALPIIQVDVFTHEAFGGNPCTVVFDADGLDQATMQRIAREMNLTVTAFVLNSERADWQLRFFTPGEEVPMASHATIAAVYGLLSSQRVRHQHGLQRLSMELYPGVTDVEIAGEPGDNPLIFLTHMRPEFMQDYDPAEVADAFSVPVSALRKGVPVTTVSSGTPQLMVPFADIGSLRRARVNHDAYAHLRAFGDFFSAHLFVTEGITPVGNTFARHFGVPPDWREDPFTGSATGSMAAYLWRHRLVRDPVLVAEQGHWLDRPGRGEVEVLGDPDDIRGVRVGGRAVEILEGMVVVPDD